MPTGISTIERAVACAMDSPFGGIGWTRLSGDDPVETDTVTFGAFRREVFERVGLFDETLVRNQDDEFNMRLRAAGGTIVLDPAITVAYRPRGSLGGVWRQYFEYGLWRVPVMIKHRRIATLRGVVPLVFVARYGRPARRGTTLADGAPPPDGGVARLRIPRGLLRCPWGAPP